MENKLSKVLTDLRAERGLTIKDLSAKTGIHFNTLHAFERGTRIPSEIVIERLAGAFDTSADRLKEIASEVQSEMAAKTEKKKRGRPAGSKNRSKASESGGESVKPENVPAPISAEESDPERVSTEQSVPEQGIEPGADTVESVASEVAMDNNSNNVINKIDNKFTTSHVFEINSRQVNVSDVEHRVIQNYLSQGHTADQINSLDVYYNFDECRAYYVINGESNGESIEF